MPHVDQKLGWEPHRIGYKHCWALCGVSLNCSFSLTSFPFAAGRFQYATVSRRMTHTLQDGTESNFAREAHKISAGRMKALFIMILQVQGHVIQTRITTNVKAVIISPKPSIGATPFEVVHYKNPLVHCERCSPVVQPARRHTSNIQTTALMNNSSQVGSSVG